MFFRRAWTTSSLVFQAVWAANNNYKWTVNGITVDSITSLEADTLTLYAIVTQLGGERLASKTVFLGDVLDQAYLTIDQINFDLEFSAPSTSNISIIWSLVNSANANHTFTDDLQHLSDDTETLAARSDEAYIVDYATNRTVKIPDAPFPVNKWGDGLVCTESWSKPKVFLFHEDKMAYYDLASNKWSTVITLSMVIDDYRFTFDGSSTIIFGSILPPAYPLIQYGADTEGLIQSILTLVLDENEPSNARFVSHPVTPFAGVDGVYPSWDAPIAYDPLRNRIYMAGGYNNSNGDSLPYLFAINMDPQAAEEREARNSTKHDLAKHDLAGSEHNVFGNEFSSYKFSLYNISKLVISKLVIAKLIISKLIISKLIISKLIISKLIISKLII
ncbi:hypothetical protein E4T51_15729, partial [Aureobasidium sp. EXF-12344]